MIEEQFVKCRYSKLEAGAGVYKQDRSVTGSSVTDKLGSAGWMPRRRN